MSVSRDFNNILLAYFSLILGYLRSHIGAVVLQYIIIIENSFSTIKYYVSKYDGRKKCNKLILYDIYNIKTSNNKIDKTTATG